MARAVQSIDNQTVRTKYIVFEDTLLRGPSAVRNFCIQNLVKTTWVGFLDDDDWLDEHYTQWLYEENTGYDMVVFRMKNSPNGAIPPPETVYPGELKYNEVGISFAMKTKVARQFPFDGIRVGEDWELIQRILSAGYKVKLSPKIAYHVRDN